MSQVSSVLRKGATAFFHWCPACEMMHPLPFSWQFDGNVDKPTFSPSFAQTYVHWTGGINEATGQGIGERSSRLCHCVITAGMIQFHSDSWHRRTDLVPMPPIPSGISDSDC